MKIGRAIWLAALLGGCGAASLIGLEIVFPDQEARSLTRSIDVSVLAPGENSSCQALLQAAAQPGDTGYDIEDRLEISYPSGADARPLDDVGPGRRLFFALALDQERNPILHGCADVDRTGRGAPGVTIELRWRCRPTNGGVETCDNLDNDCNGTVDDGNPAFLCPQVHRAEAVACTAGLCQYRCESGWYDANRSWSDGCECQPTRKSVEWCDGLDNDCDGAIDGADCRECATDLDCADPGACLDDTCSKGRCSASALPDGTSCADDGNACTDDACAGGLCQHVPADRGRACDDGSFCTVQEACDGAGNCVGSERACPQAPPCQESFCDEAADACANRPLQDGSPCPDDGVFCNGAESCLGGVCAHSGNPCPGPDGDGDCSESCSETSADCSANDPAGGPCNDGVGCTAGDACDGAGVCTGLPDHSACGTGFCLPACTDEASGCVEIGSIEVSCAEAHGDTAGCQITTDPPLSNLAACLACEAHLVEPILSFVDFEANDNPGNCDLEGWQVVPAVQQCSHRDQSCPLDIYALRPCCDRPLCPTQSGLFAGRLAVEFSEAGCATEESMRLWSAYDLRAFERALFCLDVGHFGPPTPYKALQLWQEPLAGPVFCQRADSEPRLPSEGLGRLCAPLTPAFSSPLTRLDVWMQADVYGWVVDNLWLQAGYNGCTRTTREVFREDFTGCPAVLPGSWNGWTVSSAGSAPRCQSFACLDPGLRIENGAFVLERQVDTTPLSKAAWLCWDAGSDDTYNQASTLLVEFDAGSGWKRAYDVAGPVVAGEQGVCQRNCVDLTAVDPAAAGNASLGIRFSVTAGDGVLLDRITVQGPDTCAPGNRLQLEPIIEEGAGTYGITVRNLTPHNLPVRLECTVPPASFSGDALFTFQVE